MIQFHVFCSTFVHSSSILKVSSVRLGMVAHFSTKKLHSNKGIEPNCEDFTFANFTHIKFGDRTKNQIVVLDFAKKFHPNQLKLSVLTNLCETSKIFEFLSECRFGHKFPAYDKEYHEFQFKDRIWYMTKTMKTPKYSNQRYQAIHFKLPNVKFVYSTEYVSRDPVKADVSIKKSNPDVKAFLQRFNSAVAKIPNFNPKLIPHYKIDEDRLELYYDDEEQARLLTVKFEPGTHLLVRHVDDIPWSLEEWEKHFRISEDDSEECL